MEVNIIFLNVLKYKDKETGVYKCRFSYLLNESVAKLETPYLKGLSEFSFYTNDDKLFEHLKGEDALTPMILKVEEKPNNRNPLKTSRYVTQVITKNEIIDIL